MNLHRISPSLRNRGMRHRLAGAAIYWTGIGQVYSILTRSAGAIILMYHSVAERAAAEFIDPANRMAPADFERQMAFLARHRHVVSLGDLTARLSAGEPPRPGTVCITFDDGYLDNLTVAAPVLRRLGLPATLFLPTAYIDRAQPQWVDSLYCLLRFRTAHRVAIGELGLDADLRGRGEERRARHVLHLRLLESTYEVRQRLLEELQGQLKPDIELPRLTMNWDDVRALQQTDDTFEVGGHTRHHVDLRTHRGSVAMDEVRGCAQDIERALGRRPRFFSFPYGRWSAETRAMVQQANWQGAIGASDDVLITTRTDRLVMGRPETPGSMTALRFQTSGAYPGALAMLRLH